MKATLKERPARSMQRRSLLKSRPFLLSLALTVGTTAAGLTVRFAPFGLPPFVIKYGGSMLWALLIYWIVSTIFPTARLPIVAIVAASLAAAVELIKLHHSPALDAFRRTLPGILLLGRIFSWWDILAYWLAIQVGAFIDWRIRSNQT
jgi:hypothetical protein